MAAACLQHALMPSPEVDLFSDDTLRPVTEKLLPLLISLLEDASYRSRQIAIECLAFLKALCCKKDMWNVDDLIKIYPEILKRLDDPTEKVRFSALRNLPIFLNSVPVEFKKANYRAHHELIIDTLLTHFDDDNEDVQNMVYGKCHMVFPDLYSTYRYVF
nr:dynein assembly factor 5, axonemal-like [Leptinotarsa decemlineata]